MKILYLITKANWGGAQHYVFDLACAAKDAGYEVAVAYGEPGLLVEKLKEKNIRTIPVPGLARDIGGGDTVAYRGLREIIKSERPDILHLNSSKAGALGALVGRLAGVRMIIFTDHGWAFKEKRSAPARAAIWCASWLTALLVQCIIAVSDYELEATRRMPFCSRKAVRIYNGIDLHMPFGNGEIIRNAFPPGVRITGTIGELTKNKNHIALVEEAHKDITMYVAIVGEGEDRPMLEKKIAEYGLKDRVKLFGFMPAQEVLKGFDVFSLPSIKEALAYVILEARVAGLPIIANRVGGVGEALDKDLSEFSLQTMLQKTFALYQR